MVYLGVHIGNTSSILQSVTSKLQHSSLPSNHSAKLTTTTFNVKEQYVHYWKNCYPFGMFERYKMLKWCLYSCIFLLPFMVLLARSIYGTILILIKCQLRSDEESFCENMVSYFGFYKIDPDPNKCFILHNTVFYLRSTHSHLCEFFCLFDLILYIPSTIFQFCRDRSSWFEPALS